MFKRRKHNITDKRNVFDFFVFGKNRNTMYAKSDNRFVEVETRDWRSQKNRTTRLHSQKFELFSVLFRSNVNVKALCEIITVSGVFGSFWIPFGKMCWKHVISPSQYNVIL